jgi:aspartate kinase
MMATVDVDVMAEMSFAGAKVMNSRAVELAALCGLDIHVGSSSTGKIGTVISRGEIGAMLETSSTVVAVVHDTDVAHVEVRCATTNAGTAGEVFQTLARAAIAVDMVTISEEPAGGFAVDMTARRADAQSIRDALRQLAEAGDGQVDVYEELGKVSIVGTGLLNRPEYAARMLSALTDVNINTRSIEASQARICVTVPLDDIVRAVRVLHRRFGLDEGAPTVVAGSPIPA